MRRLIHGLLGLSLLLTACGNDDGDDLSAVTSVPEETTSSTTTTTEARTVAPDVIPQDVSQITEEYVEQVLDSLYEVSLESVLATRDAGLVEERAIALNEAIHTQEHAVRSINSLAELAREGFPGFRSDPEPVDVAVLGVLTRSRSCVFAEITSDSSGLLEEPSEPQAGARGFVRLLPASDEQRSNGNPTAWVIDDLPATDDGSVPEETCQDA